MTETHALCKDSHTGMPFAAPLGRSDHCRMHPQVGLVPLLCFCSSSEISFGCSSVMVVETLPTCTSVLSLKARDVPRDQARFSGVFSICSWSIRKGESSLQGVEKEIRSSRLKFWGLMCACGTTGYFARRYGQTLVLHPPTVIDEGAAHQLSPRTLNAPDRGKKAMEKKA